MTEDQIKDLERRLAALEARVAQLPKELPKNPAFIKAMASKIAEANDRQRKRWS